MKRWIAALTALASLLALVSPSPACILCPGNVQTASTFRQDGRTAKMVLYGTLRNARLNANGSGTTDLDIERVLKNDPFLAGKKMLTLPRYQPADPKDPPKYVVFCDLANGRLDPLRGVPASAALVQYVKGIIDLDPNDPTAALLYFFRFLDAEDQVVANDAYVEFAKATDAEIGRVARLLSPEKLRKMIQHPQTPANRLGLFMFLLGGCGNDSDARLLLDLIKNPAERTTAALDGALSGYIQLRPREGWQLAQEILRDSKRSFTQRCAVIGTVRFYHQWKGKEIDREVLRSFSVLLDQGDIADMAIENLRQWKLWDLTPTVLAQYGKKSHDAPIMRRAIVRYALCCPRDDAARFVGQRRKQDSDLVKDVEESLQFEKK